MRWRDLAQTQLAALRVHAPDLRGQGYSVPEPPWTLEQHADDLLDTLDALGLSTVDVVAPSFGGAVAVALLAAAPDRVRRLVLLDPTIRVPAPVADALARAALDEPTYDDPGHAIDAQAEDWGPAVPRHFAEQEVADHLVLGPDERWRWRRNPAAIVTGFAELARPMPAPPTGTPILLVVATRSKATRGLLPAWSEALGGDLTVVELDCGHQVTLEQPERTGELIRDFLS